MDRDRIRRQLTEAVAAVLELNPSRIDPDASFDALGFDSMGKVSLVPEMERLFGCSLDSEVLFDYPNLNSLAGHVESVLCEQAPT